MKVTYPLVIIVSCLMFACSNPPLPETNYYLLNTPTKSAAKTDPLVSDLQEKKLVQLNLELAYYLQQPFLVMQTDNNILHYAQSHMWAEPLAKEINQALFFDLRQLDKEDKYHWLPVRNAVKLNNTEYYNLAVSVEYFHANTLGKVVLSGSYQWLVPAQEKRTKYQNFYFESELQLDGYAHSVSQMRVLLNELAKQIAGDIPAV